MLSESYVIDPTPDYPLFLIAKRYWIPEFDRHAANPAAVTLIVLHSTSFHKETWEPALEDLFALAAQSCSTALIREAWAIDCPNHGEAGQRNRDTLCGPDFVECAYTPLWTLNCSRPAQSPARSMRRPCTAFCPHTRRRRSGGGALLASGTRWAPTRCAFPLLFRVMPRLTCCVGSFFRLYSPCLNSRHSSSSSQC